MSLNEKIEQVGTSLATYVAVSAAAAVGWVVRRVLTNQKQIEMLQREIDHRDTLRNEDREAMGEVRDSVKRIENVLMTRGPRQ